MLLPGGIGEAALLASARDALSVLDFEAVARARIPAAHWGCLATGSDDDGTLRANAAAFATYQLRVRRLVDGSKLDTSVELFGTRWATPIFLSPVGSLNIAASDGELAVARAARAAGHLRIMSTMSTMSTMSGNSVEAVTAALGRPPWFQLYPQNEWALTRQIVRRAEAAGCRILVLSIDGLGGAQSRNFGAQPGDRHARLRRLSRPRPQAPHESPADDRGADRVAHAGSRDRDSELGLHPPPAGRDVDEAAAQGDRDARGRGTRRSRRCRRANRVEPWRPD